MRITMTPAAHWSARGIFDRRQTLWGGYHVRCTKTQLSFWFAGDCRPYCIPGSGLRGVAVRQAPPRACGARARGGMDLSGGLCLWLQVTLATWPTPSRRSGAAWAPLTWRPCMWAGMTIPSALLSLASVVLCAT